MSASDLTKKSIVQSTKSLVCDKNFEKISVIEIANKCGINRNTFYYYFKDKYEVLEWIFHDEIEPVLESYFQNKNITKSIMVLCNLMKKEKLFYTKALEITNHNSLRQLLVNYYIKYLINVGVEHYTRLNINDENQEIIARFYSHGIVGLISDWSRCGMKKDADTVTTMVMLSFKEQFYI